VIGLDVSINLLKIAKSRWPRAQLVRGDMRFLPFKHQTFAAAISMDQSFGYLPSLQDDLQSLLDLHATLRKGGVLIVDLFNREYLIKKDQVNPLPKGREYPSFFLVKKWTIDFSSGILHEQWTIYDWVEGDIKLFKHITRLYTFGDMQNLLENAGFMVKAIYGDYEMQNLTDNSNRLIFLAKTI
jgi:SAM-dependent methyltransferase